MTKATNRLSVLGVALAIATGCAAQGETDFEEIGVECSGKCDGLGGSIRSLWDRARRVDRGDLVNVTAGLATDELNDALAFDNAAVGFDAPELYALDSDASGDLTLHNLDQLTHGLAYTYGERELTTAVNRVRQQHLRDSGDVVFAEAAFSIEGRVSHGWNLETGGLAADGSWVNIGFTAGARLESRVIGAFGNEIRSNGQSMLRAMRESRGFVLPRGVDDIRDMSPGESIALSGEGALGINIGAGVPLIIAEPTTHLTYNIIVSGALRARLEGQLDVQLVRMDGDDVYIDVGTTKVFEKSAQLAISDGWGVGGFIETEIEIANRTVNLGRIVERALESQLNKQINLIDGRLERTGRDSRLSVARFRFDLDQLTHDGEQALEQVLSGDVRLAQLLSNEGEPGVHAEFDLLRTGESTTGYAGIDILGMSFFREKIEREGTTVIQTPGGVRTIMFDSLHREAGWFFSSHGYTRVGLSGMVWDPRAPGAPEGEANLFIQVVEGDEYMQRDKVLDHLDPLLVAVGGQEAFTVLEGYSSDLEAHTERLCSPSSRAGAACLEAVLADPETIRLRTDGLAAFARELSGLSEELTNLAIDAARLRLTAHAAVEYAASLTGPESSVVLDYRLDDAALNDLMVNKSGDELTAAVNAYLQLAEVDRDDLLRDRRDVVTNNASEVRRLAEIFEASRAEYEAVLSAENAVLDGIGRIGATALEVRFDVDRSGAPIYESATARSLSQARASVATRLYDSLVEEADELPGVPEQIVAYSLLSMTPVESRDVRLDMRFDTGSWVYDHYEAAGYDDFDWYAKGARVEHIDGGLFDIDALLRVD
jgi:hypothetical protein